MALVVQKYGGTSVGTVEKIKNVARRVARARDEGHQVVVVVSAMAGETDKLVGLANDICEIPDEREYDVLVASGEQVTIALLSMCLKSMGYDATKKTSGSCWADRPSSFHSPLFLRVHGVPGGKNQKQLVVRDDNGRCRSGTLA